MNSLEEKILDITKVIDNGGKTADRYLVFTPDGSIYNMSSNPDSPQGVNNYVEDYKYGLLPFRDEYPDYKLLDYVPQNLKKSIIERMYNPDTELGYNYFVDLHEFYLMQPDNVKWIMEKYSDLYGDELDYKHNAQLVRELESIGYTYEYDMSSGGFALRPIELPLYMVIDYTNNDYASWFQAVVNYIFEENQEEIDITIIEDEANKKDVLLQNMYNEGNLNLKTASYIVMDDYFNEMDSEDEYERGGKIVHYKDGRKRRLDTWNRGRAWTMDRKYYNKNEDWEVPMNERKSNENKITRPITKKIVSPFFSGLPTEIKSENLQEEKQEENQINPINLITNQTQTQTEQTNDMANENQNQMGYSRGSESEFFEGGGKIVKYKDGRKRRLDTWNSGRSWTMDRKYYNKNEDWEIPMDKRSSKSFLSGETKTENKDEKSFLSGEPTEVKKQEEVKKDDTNWSWLGFEEGGEMVNMKKQWTVEIVDENSGDYMSKVVYAKDEQQAISNAWFQFSEDGENTDNFTLLEVKETMEKGGSIKDKKYRYYILERKDGNVKWVVPKTIAKIEEIVKDAKKYNINIFAANFGTWESKKDINGNYYKTEIVNADGSDFKTDKEYDDISRMLGVVKVKNYESGGGVDGRSTRDKSTWNRGSSWTRDRNSFNKSEDWEIPMNERLGAKSSSRSSAKSSSKSYSKSKSTSKSGKGKSYSYIPNAMLREAEIENNGKRTYIDAKDILDGIYVKKGTKYESGGGVGNDEKSKIISILDKHNLWNELYIISDDSDLISMQKHNPSENDKEKIATYLLSWETAPKVKFSSRDLIEILESQNIYKKGGGVDMEISKEQLENMVGRKLNGWNDDKVEYKGLTYQKCFLKPFYKVV